MGNDLSTNGCIGAGVHYPYLCPETFIHIQNNVSSTDIQILIEVKTNSEIGSDEQSGG